MSERKSALLMCLVCWTWIEYGRSEVYVSSQNALHVGRKVPIFTIPRYEIGERRVVRRIFAKVVNIFNASTQDQDEVALHSWVLPLQGRFHIRDSNSYAETGIRCWLWKNHVSKVFSCIGIVAYSRSRVARISYIQLGKDAYVLGDRVP